MLSSCLAEKLLYCPTCRSVVDGEYRDSPIHLAESLCEEDGCVLHGFLACDACPARYPIIDGIPVLVRDPGQYLTRMEDAVLWREDLPPALGGWLQSQYEENCDPGWRRQMLAVYGTTLQPPPETDDSVSAVVA